MALSIYLKAAYKIFYDFNRMLFDKLLFYDCSKIHCCQSTYCFFMSFFLMVSIFSLPLKICAYYALFYVVLLFLY